MVEAGALAGPLPGETMELTLSDMQQSPTTGPLLGADTHPQLVVSCFPRSGVSIVLRQHEDISNCKGDKASSKRQTIGWS